MKKQYTRPTIVKVELNHEQAILGACHASAAGKLADGNPLSCHQNCKALNKTPGAPGAGNSAGTS